MKVLMLNGSPKANGNTNAALLEVGRTLENEGISYEIFQMGGKPVRKLKKRTDLCSVHRYIMLTRADVSCHSLTERSMQAVRLSDSSPVHRLRLQDEEAVQHRSIA